VFYSSFVCISAYANVYFKTILRECLRARLPSGFASTAPPRRKEGEWGEGPSLATTTMFCSEFDYVFWLSVSMRKVAGEHLFCVLIYMNSYIFQICSIFIYFIVIYLIFDFVCWTLSLADTHGIAKYARTYIRDTHARTHKTKTKK